MSATAKAPRQVDPLAPVASLAAELREAEMETAKARARFEQAVLNCAGISHERIANAAGLSRQRIQQVLAKRPK